MSPEHDLVQALVQLFPSFRGLPPGEPERRAEALGLYTAQVWAAGPDGLRARGVVVPPQVHAPLAPIAPRVVQARQGGATFLTHVRRGLGDAGFAQAITGLARLYAESLRSVPAGAGRATRELASFAALIEDAPGAAPSRPAPPPRGPAGPPGSFEALVGGGLSPEEDAGPPIVAPPSLAPPSAAPQVVAPQRVSAPAAQQPAARPRPAPAPASPGWGDLDLLPEGTAVSAVAAPPPAAAQPAPAAPRDYGGLELLPEEPEEPEDDGRPALFMPGVDVDGAADPRLAGPSTTAPPAPARAGGLRPAPAAAPAADGDDEALEDEPAPRDPVMAALRRFERQGELAALGQAEQLLRAELARAPHDVAAAAALSGLARVELLRGRAPAASKLAADALLKDPSSPLAVEVLVRLGRGEAELAPLRAAVAHLREALDARDPQKIRATADRFRKAFPDEPHAYLALFVLGKLTDDERLLESGLKEAWRRFPSPRAATLPFGGAVDADLVDLLVHRGREPFKDKDDARLRHTVEDIDDRDNVIAGALRMALALARVALARPGLPRGLARRLTFAVGRGLVGLQYYDAAVPCFAKASSMGAGADELKAISNERVNAGALRRAFDRPGIKAQLKAYTCVGVQGMSEHLRRSLEAVRKDREAKEREAFARGGELALEARADASLKAEVAAAAQAASLPDPFAAINAAEAELAQIARERQQGKDPQPQGGGGLFGKLKAAASSVTGAAKDGLLSLKESQATTRRDEAAKHLGVTLARSLADVEWEHPSLVRLARELATIEAFLDYFQTEESRAKAELGRLAGSV